MGRWWIGLIGGALLVSNLGAAPAVAAQGVRLGVVNIQEVLNQSQRGKGAKQKLDQERAGRQRELEVKQQELVKLQTELEKQGPVLSEQAKREKADALQRRARDIRRMVEDANRDFEKRVQEAEVDITREIFAVIQEFGKDQNYTLIMERSTLVYSAAGVDVTAEIVKRYDAKQK